MDIQMSVAFLIILHAFWRQLTLLKILSRIPLEGQTAWIQIRLDIMSGLIRVQTVRGPYH